MQVYSSLFNITALEVVSVEAKFNNSYLHQNKGLFNRSYLHNESRNACNKEVEMHAIRK